MTYTPTKEELEELGFIQTWLPSNKVYILPEGEDTTLLYYNHPDDMFPWYMPSFYVNNVIFYPRSREHLQSIILSFTPE